MNKVEDIVNKKFAHSFMGYDVGEVDRFLDEIIDRMTQLENEREKLIRSIEYLLKELEQFDDVVNAAMTDAGKPADGNKPKARKTTASPIRITAPASGSADAQRAEEPEPEELPTLQTAAEPQQSEETKAAEMQAQKPSDGQTDSRNAETAVEVAEEIETGEAAPAQENAQSDAS